MTQSLRILLALCLIGAVAAPVLADGGVVFTNIAHDPATGIDFARERSVRDAQYRDLLANWPFMSGTDFPPLNRQELPLKWRGAPGVAILDYDNDGDLDIYATNGPNASNALYSNQLVETGSVTFVDEAATAGVEAFDRDSTGVCFGDIDNDGDSDIYVLSTADLNVLYENQGDGTFEDITADSGTAGDARNPTSCTMADFNGDGLLDIVVGNTFDNWTHRLAHAQGPTYEFLEHNYLFVNEGDNEFSDESASSGLETVSNMSGPGLTGAAYTWALAAADYDLDGDVDILFADNQGPPALDPSQERGYLRLYDNDGTGVFTEVTYAAGLDITGGWMGLDMGDLDCDGNMDFFATDVGYAAGAPSRWFFGQNDGSFVQTDLDGMIMTPFGWGTSLFDYDNDGDTDITYHGGMHLWTWLLSENPGVVLQNTGQCSGTFVWDDQAIPALDPPPAPPITEHSRRVVQGMAVGDLDGNGFEDIVSISSENATITSRFIPAVGPPFFVLGPPTGSPFDVVNFVEAVYVFIPGVGFIQLSVIPTVDGDVAVELNSGDNGNGWVEITAAGSAGVLDDDDDVQLVPRDGIGAVVFFTPDGGSTSMRPVIGGSSYASQDALAANFGLGSAASGTAEILWPGGVRNKLYDVANGERLVMPHIPCSYDADWKNFGQYNSCVMQALNTYKNEGLINSAERNRLRDSARQAYDDAQ